MNNPTCELIKESFHKDSIGNELSETTIRKIFCEEISISRNEFFQAAQNNLKTEKIIKIHSVDYKNETLVKSEGVTFNIYRTFARKDGYIELYLIKKNGFN